jgi:predicted DNA-binding protein YlxM (UPF0122 family)
MTSEQYHSMIKKPQSGTITEAILTLAATTPATPPEIAESVNTSRQMVHQVLERYGIEPNHAESFKEHRADILAGMQEKILRSIDLDEIKKSPFGTKIMATGILYDKERIERGLSDNNTRPMVVIQVKGDANVTLVDPVHKPVDEGHNG